VIETIEAKCKDCYKCLRSCPVKAIRMERGDAPHELHARVAAERCVYDGTCVLVCPQRAKRVASDLHKVRSAIAGGAKVAASLAPSFPSAFALDGVNPLAVPAALRRLGFQIVQETAVGAELVGAEHARVLRETSVPLISSSCPAVVNLIERHYPEVITYLAPIVSPMIAHGRFLKRLVPGVKVAFIGPCIAKHEERAVPGLDDAVDFVLTFDELAGVFTQEGIDLSQIEPEDFDGPAPDLARLFPVSGGMLRASRLSTDMLDREVLSVSGMNNCREVLRWFVETLQSEKLGSCGACDATSQHSRGATPDPHNAGAVLPDPPNTEALPPDPRTTDVVTPDFHNAGAGASHARNADSVAPTARSADAATPNSHVAPTSQLPETSDPDHEAPLAGAHGSAPRLPRLVEMLACEGGCINGPMNPARDDIYARRARVLEYMERAGHARSQPPTRCSIGAIGAGEDAVPVASEQDRDGDRLMRPDEHVTLGPTVWLPRNLLHRSYRNLRPVAPTPDEDAIKAVLAKTGKYAPDDELNCGACGYDSCRDKAIAVLHGMADPEMCIPYMRERAESMANVFVASAPYAIIVVDEDEVIRDLNAAAERMFGRSRHEMLGGKLGAFIDPSSFRQVLDAKTSLQVEVAYPELGLVTRQTIFYEPEERLAMAIIADITEERSHAARLQNLRAETLEKAQGVIDKQMEVAQKIAGLLGETTAETKVLLTRLMNVFREEGKGNGGPQRKP
jgi:iron only hydrogenase large subunit-like protein/uncharacterized Fe-S cluster-containing protein